MNLEDTLAICDTPAPAPAPAKKTKKVAKKNAPPSPPVETASPPVELAVVPTLANPPVENAIDFEAEYYRLLAENTRLLAEIDELKATKPKASNGLADDEYLRYDPVAKKSFVCNYWEPKKAETYIGFKVMAVPTHQKRDKTVKQMVSAGYYTVDKKNVVADANKRKYPVSGNYIHTINDDGDAVDMRLMIVLREA